MLHHPEPNGEIQACNLALADGTDDHRCTLGSGHGDNPHQCACGLTWAPPTEPVDDSLPSWFTQG